MFHTLQEAIEEAGGDPELDVIHGISLHVSWRILDTEPPDSKFIPTEDQARRFGENGGLKNRLDAYTNGGFLDRQNAANLL